MWLPRVALSVVSSRQSSLAQYSPERSLSLKVLSVMVGYAVLMYRSAEVAKRYLDVRDRLIPVGLDVRRVRLDPRGAWDMTLHNGVEVRLGRRDVDARTNLFLDVVADIITGRAADIEYVDMRYSNGFTIGWNNGSRTPVEDSDERVEEMLALRGEG